MLDASPNHLVPLLFLAALVTYCTRIGGHVVLSRFKRIHPRVEAALEAVPAAVLMALVVPPALTNGLIEALAMIVAVIICLRLPPIAVLGVGLLIIVLGRQVGY